MKRYKRHLPKDHKKQKMEYEKTKKKEKKKHNPGGNLVH